MSTDPKAQSRERFSQYAQNYVTSSGHAKGDELSHLVEIAAPQPDSLALDIATGGGHTALKFAPHVRRVIATDYAPTMLGTARTFIESKGASNVLFVPADAENLPFAANVFDLITCRIAPHHFPDIFRFVMEAVRALKPGGMLLVQDLTVPDDERAARYVDSFERLRDPSHVRCYAEYEWRGLYLDAGLTVEHTEQYRRPANMLEWARHQGSSDYVIERLRVLMVQAPDAVKEWLNIRCAGTADATFDHVYVIIAGKKPL
jgi:ubiquinone/menaquinone biosynthesis C-methylase UbiE